MNLYPLVRPFLHHVDPERAHAWALRMLAYGFVPSPTWRPDPLLSCEFFGERLEHPLGLAAGFDKNARAVGRLGRLGCSFAEIGGITPLPQRGNPRPRVFRLPEDQAVINRMGFPNEGAEQIELRLACRPGYRRLGINLAANADSRDPIADFVALARRFAPYAMYLTLDISCPNTANGQVFLEPQRLRELLDALRGIEQFGARPRYVAKLSPDIPDETTAQLADVLEGAHIDAICVGNTTSLHPSDLRATVRERGGLSGVPLHAINTRQLKFVYSRVGRRIPLIGTGGIASGRAAFEKIRAGASVLQLYTALIYHGPAIIPRILTELAELLRAHGFGTLEEAIGTGKGV